VSATSTSNGYTTGKILAIDLTQSAATGTSLFPATLLPSLLTQPIRLPSPPRLSPATLPTFPEATTTNASFASTLTVSGALARFSDSATQTTGTLTSTANGVEILENYTGNSGSALNVTTAGTGPVARFNDDGSLTDSTPVLIDATGQLAIGNTSPGSLLGVGSSAQLKVDTSG
jgi:hypothetical protein